MDTQACVLNAIEDLRFQAFPLPEMNEDQVLVRIGAGGICGSDLHYFFHGGFGTVRVKEPMVLGHEVAGTVQAVGKNVTRVKPGDRIALNPSRPCGKCKFCQSGEHMHCLDMWFYGSAMRTPHSQGAFRQHIVAEEYQCEPVGNEVSLGEAACAEPLAVALHAVNQAGPIAGKKVLVTGAGPIGVLVTAAARYAGAVEVVSTDLQDAALNFASAMGATDTVNVSVGAGLKADVYTAEKGYFDVAIDCTGAAGIYADVLPALRPRGTLVQVGVNGEVPLPMNVIVGKEIRLQGAFRFHSEYALAARLIKEGRINVKPMISATLPATRASEAFHLAADRSAQMKVQISFAD